MFKEFILNTGVATELHNFAVEWNDRLPELHMEISQPVSALVPPHEHIMEQVKMPLAAWHQNAAARGIAAAKNLNYAAKLILIE